MEIFTLLKSNFKHKKGSSISVIILMTIISLALSTILSVDKNISSRYDEAIKNIEVGDLNFFISDLNDVDSITSKVKNNENVDHVLKEEMLSSKVIINNNKSNNNKSTNSYLMKKYDKNNFEYNVYDESGLKFIDNKQELQEGEAYVPISFKEMHNCNLGDIIEVSNKKIKIKGFIEEPFIGATTMGIKQFFINEKDFNDLYKIRFIDEESIENKKETDVVGYFLVSVFQKEDSKLSSVLLQKEINKESKIVNLSLISLSKEQSKNYTGMFAGIISSVLFVFVFLLFIVILIVITHSIGSSIEIDYVNLGILKSQGFTKSLLIKIYFYQYLISQLIGAGIGIILSLFIIPYICRIFSIMTGLLPSNKVAIVEVFVLSALIILISSLLIILKTRKIGKVSPIIAISGGREEVYFDNSIKLPINKKSLSLSLAIRQLFSNKKQYISSLLIASILCFFMISVSSLNNVMDNKKIVESFGGFFSDFAINYNKSNDLKEEIEEKISNISKIEENFQYNSNYFTLDENEIYGQILDKPSFYKSVIKGREPKYNNEIIITEITAELLGKTIGDKVKVTYKEESQEFIICGIYQCTNDSGYTFGMLLDGMKRLDKNYKINWVDYTLKDTNKVDEILEMLKKNYGEKITVKDMREDDDMIEYIEIAIKALNVLIYGLSIIFVLVVSVMVCSRMFLKEKKEFGIYKSIGFTTNHLRLLFSIRFLLVSIVGSLIGFTFNYLFNDKLMSMILKSMGIFKFETDYNIQSVLIPCLLISISYFVFSYLLSYKIKKVSVKELITE